MTTLNLSDFGIVQRDLNDLSNVDITSPQAGEFLKWDSVNWINDIIEISDVNNLQTTIDAITVGSLADVSLVNLVNGDILIYNATSSAWESAPNEVAGLSPVAYSGDFADLSSKLINTLEDVTLTTATADQVLTFDGAVWVNADLPFIPLTMDDLTDVEAIAPAEGDVLTFDSGVGNWIATASNAGVSSTVMYVDPKGNDSSGNGSNIRPFQTIGRAIDEIGDGSSDADLADNWGITVGQGTYLETITMPVYRSINFIAVGIVRLGDGGADQATRGDIIIPHSDLSVPQAVQNTSFIQQYSAITEKYRLGDNSGWSVAGDIIYDTGDEPISNIGRSVIGLVGVSVAGSALKRGTQVFTGLDVYAWTTTISSIDQPNIVLRIFQDSKCYGDVSVAELGSIVGSDIRGNLTINVGVDDGSDNKPYGIYISNLEGSTVSIPPGVEIDVDGTTWNLMNRNGVGVIGGGTIRVVDSGTTIGELIDVNTAGATAGQVLVWDGSLWVADDQSGGTANNVDGVFWGTPPTANKLLEDNGKTVHAATDEWSTVIRQPLADENLPKIYAEFVATGAASDIIEFGVVNADTATIVGVQPSVTTDYIAISYTDSKVYVDGVEIAQLTTTLLDPSLSQTVSMAFDSTTGNGWIGVNNVWDAGGDPVAGTNPTFLPEHMVNFGSAIYYANPFTADATINSPAVFTYEAPAGYENLQSTPVVKGRLGDLDDVTIVSPTEPQFLGYDTTSSDWINKLVNYADLGIKPNLTDITDVTTTSAAIGDLMRWDGTFWVNQPFPTITSTLADLTDTEITSPQNLQGLQWDDIAGLWKNQTINLDVSVSTLTDTTIGVRNPGEVLKWDGATWLNEKTDWSELTNIPTFSTVATSGSYNDLVDQPAIPVNSDFAFTGLSDATATPLNNGILRWDPLGTSIYYVAQLTPSDINGLATVAVTGSYSDLSDIPTFSTVATTGSYDDLINQPFIPLTIDGLSDVDTSTIAPATNQLLRWDGTNWISSTENDTNTDSLADLTDTTIATPTNSQVLRHDGTDWKNAVLSYNDLADQIDLSVYTIDSTLHPVAKSGDYNALINQPAIPGINEIKDIAGTLVGPGSIQKGLTATYNSGNRVYDFNVKDPTISVVGAVAGSATMVDLNNVTINVIQQDNSVTLGTSTLGNYVESVTGGSGIDIVNGTPAEGFIPEVIVDSSVIRTTGDQNISGNMQIDGNLTVTGELTSTIENEIVDPFVILNGDSADVPLNNSGIKIYRGLETEAVMQWNETNDDWEITLGDGVFNKMWHAGNDGAGSGLDSDLLDGQQGTYYLDYSNFTNTPAIPVNSDFTLSGLSDTAAPIADGYLQWDATATQVIYSATIPSTDVIGLADAAYSGNYNDLLGLPTLVTELTNLSDVNITTPAALNVLKYNGFNWLNEQLDYSELSGLPVLFSGDYNDLINTPTNSDYTVAGLGDTLITTPQIDDTLLFDGTNWYNTPFPTTTDEVIYVSTYGDDTDADGTQFKPFQTPKAAVDYANSVSDPGSPRTVQVLPGVYDVTETIEMSNRSVSLQGLSPTTCLLLNNGTSLPTIRLTSDIATGGSRISNIGLVGALPTVFASQSNFPITGIEEVKASSDIASVLFGSKKRNDIEIPERLKKVIQQILDNPRISEETKIGVRAWPEGIDENDIGVEISGNGSFTMINTVFADLGKGISTGAGVVDEMQISTIVTASFTECLEGIVADGESFVTANGTICIGNKTGMIANGNAVVEATSVKVNNRQVKDLGLDKGVVATTGKIIVKQAIIGNTTTGIEISSIGELDIDGASFDDNALDVNQVNTQSIVKITNSVLDPSKLSLVNPENATFTYNDSVTDNFLVGSGNSIVRIDARKGNIALAAGSPQDPMVTIRNNDNTGMYSPGNNQLAFSVGGQQALSILDNGAVQVGFTNYDTIITNDNDLPNKKYVDDRVATGGVSIEDLPVLQVRRTSILDPIPTTWADIVMSTTDVNTNSDMFELDQAAKQNVIIKEDGWYMLYYNASVNDQAEGRLVIDGTTVIAGSEKDVGEIYDTGDQYPVPVGLTTQCYANLTAGQTITWQMQSNRTTETLMTGAHMVIQRSQGIRGAQGAKGDNAGDTLATLQARLPKGVQFPVQGAWFSLPYNTVDVRTDPSVIDINPDGSSFTIGETNTYFLHYHLSASFPGSVNAEGRILKNGNIEVPGSATTDVIDSEPGIVGVTCTAALSAGDIIETQFIFPGASGTATITGDAVITIYKLTGAEGPEGPAGPQGTGDVILEDNGTPLAGTFGTLNFSGDSVTVVDEGSGKATINVAAKGGSTGSTYFADQFFSPTTTAWAVDNPALIGQDPDYPAITNRIFDATNEQGAGFMYSIPDNATVANFTIKGRKTTTNTGNLVFRIYKSEIPDGGIPAAWSQAIEITVPTTADVNFHYYKLEYTLADLGLNAGSTYQFELTRKGDTDGITSSFYMMEFQAEIV